MYLLLAELIVLIHFLFILLVIFGGLLVLKWPRLLWWHLVVLAWGIYIEFSGGICPLTPLEIRLRHLAGDAGYSGGFINQYIVPIIYPAGLTHSTQIIFGVILIVFNLVVYSLFYYLQRKKRPQADSSS